MKEMLSPGPNMLGTTVIRKHRKGAVVMPTQAQTGQSGVPLLLQRQELPVLTTTSFELRFDLDLMGARAFDAAQPRPIPLSSTGSLTGVKSGGSADDSDPDASGYD
jgi:hypothetical protein